MIVLLVFVCHVALNLPPTRKNRNAHRQFDKIFKENIFRFEDGIEKRIDEAPPQYAEVGSRFVRRFFLFER